MRSCALTLIPHIPAGLLAGALLTATLAHAAGTESQSFIKRAIEGNVAEIAIGQLAVEKGGTPAIKNLGKMLIDDHTKANQAAGEVAKGIGVSIGTATAAGRDSEDDKLAKEPSKQFDTDVVNKLLQQHQTTIDDYQKAANDLKDAAGSYASAQLPVLKKHLADLQKIARDMGI